MATFSRLQLAAALLEYDNDPTNPDAPYRSAHDSAIFAHLRRNFGVRPRHAARSSDYLGVSLPSDNGSVGGRESSLANRRSGGSIDALRNPFGPDEILDGEPENEEEEMEVDLTSWGLDAFMPKDQRSKSVKGKGKSVALPNPHPVSSVPSHQPRTNHDSTVITPRRAAGARSMSLGTFDNIGVNAQNLMGLNDHRRRSIGSPLDRTDVDPYLKPRRALSQVLLETSAGASPHYSVPFPTDSVRSKSPTPNDALRPPSRASRLDQITHSRERSFSNPSIDSRMLLQDDHADSTPTIFKETLTSPLPADDNPFALSPPSRASRFDPKAAAHARTMSNASIGSHMLLDNDGASAVTGQEKYNRERPYSTLELLRPKVLVMPSPLQPVTDPVPTEQVNPRDGFQISTDGPPLPPGARSSRRYSAALSLAAAPPAPNPANSFTPNPRMDLSLAQLTFRNSLMVGGQRDVAYSDIDNALPRATEDGEQAHPDPPWEEDLPVQGPQITEESSRAGRPAGKLFGKSLIDDLEHRKVQMRNKQRVFTGDQRPSMMARNQIQRSSTLVDPNSLHIRPVSLRRTSYGPQESQQPLGRRNSAKVKPLLNFDDDKPTQPNLSPNARRSVFGVDTLWEREMAKLREIEAREKIETEERLKREEEEKHRQSKKRGKKGKRKGKSRVTDNVDSEKIAENFTGTVVEPRVSIEPPVLPAIQPTIRRLPRTQDDDTESDESAVVESSEPPIREAIESGIEGWLSGSSDEERNGPQRTTGTGLRYPNRSRRGQAEPPSESDEDIPLSATLGRAVQRATRFQSGASSDDEEQPLSNFLKNAVKFNNPSSSKRRADDDDDDEPLGLRVTRIASSPQAHVSVPEEGDDDNRPLAFHPEQQRRTQYQMIAQQQQQLLMQAQLRNSMFFAPSAMIGPGFFGPPMAAPVMVQHPPMQIPSPTPMHDPAKYGQVDRWRRNVAVEGDL